MEKMILITLYEMNNLKKFKKNKTKKNKLLFLKTR